MKTKILTPILALIACVAHAGVLSFATPPQDTDNATTLQQRIAAATYAKVTSDNDSTTTAATGTNWTALATHTARVVTVINTTGTAISVRYGTGTAISLPDGSAFTFEGLTDSNGLQVKRTDSSNTQVAVAWNWKNF